MSRASNTPFAQLLNARKDKFRLLETYDSVLQELLRKKKWSRGDAEPLQRIPWGQAEQIKQCETFKACGLYVWGVADRPIYVGITRTRFRTRFKRYIWEDRSQCKLAQRHGKDLRKYGLGGFSKADRRWYKQNYRGSTVPLKGAVRFAQEGIRNIWFALLPHSRRSDIRKLEKALIPVAEAWNALHEYRPLVNIQG